MNCSTVFVKGTKGALLIRSATTRNILIFCYLCYLHNTLNNFMKKKAQHDKENDNRTHIGFVERLQVWDAPCYPKVSNILDWHLLCHFLYTQMHIHTHTHTHTCRQACKRMCASTCTYADTDIMLSTSLISFSVLT